MSAWPPSRGGSSSLAGTTISGVLDFGRAGLDVQPVIAQRQVGGQLEGGLTDQPVAEIVWGSVVLQLAHAGADAAVLEPDPQADRVAVGDVHPERRFGAGAADDGRRQGAAPVVAVVAPSAAARSSSVAAGTPSAASTATNVVSGTSTWRPVQSSYSVATP